MCTEIKHPKITEITGRIGQALIKHMCSDFGLDQNQMCLFNITCIRTHRTNYDYNSCVDYPLIGDHML